MLEIEEQSQIRQSTPKICYLLPKSLINVLQTNGILGLHPQIEICDLIANWNP